MTGKSIVCVGQRATIRAKVQIPESIPAYTGEYDVTPATKEVQVLHCAGKKMLHNVQIFKIPYWETSNADGTTVYIGKESRVDGNQ